MEVRTSAAPSKVKIFTFLLLSDGVLTHDLMQRRGMHCEMTCAMCDVCPVETSHHLFFQCSNALEVWGKFHALLQGADTIEQIWEDSIRYYCQATGQQRGVGVTTFMAVLWSLWRQRNEAIFRGVKQPTWQVASRAMEDAVLWTRYCGKGPNNRYQNRGAYQIREGLQVN